MAIPSQERKQMEYTNQFEDLIDNEQMFDDVEINEETHEEPTEPQETTETVEPFLSVRYDKNDVPLTREEAITLAQKGMNYGRLEEKLNHANQNYQDLHSKLENYASTMGLDYDTYLSRLDQLNVAYVAKGELENIKKEYPDIQDEKLLNDLANARALTKINQLGQMRKEEVKRTKDLEQEKIGRMIDNFSERYPDVDVTKLDPRVYELMDTKGYTLLEAYGTWAYERSLEDSKAKEAQRLADEKNAKNKGKTYGDLTTSEIDDDPFLMGLNE